MRVVMTGASGFLGSALLRAAPPAMVITSLGRTRPAIKRPNLTHIEADLSHPDAVRSVLESSPCGDVDTVIHLAVSRHHRSFPEAALDMFDVDTASVAVLLDFAHRTGARNFILGSTGTVYHPFPRPEHREEDATAPASYFALTKWVAERLALSYSPRLFRVFVPRFFTPYGPGQKDRLVADLIARVRSGQPVQLPPAGDGLSTTPLYIDDAVRVLLTAIEQSWEGVINIGGPECLTLVQMAETIGRTVGRRPLFERSPTALGASLVPDLGRLRARMRVDDFSRFEAALSRFAAP